jgi:hypothetical protein
MPILTVAVRKMSQTFDRGPRLALFLTWSSWIHIRPCPLLLLFLSTPSLFERLGDFAECGDFC